MVERTTDEALAFAGVGTMDSAAVIVALATVASLIRVRNGILPACLGLDAHLVGCHTVVVTASL